MKFSELVWTREEFNNSVYSQTLIVGGIAGTVAWVIMPDVGGYRCVHLGLGQPTLRTNSPLEVAVWLMDKEPTPENT